MTPQYRPLRYTLLILGLWALASCSIERYQSPGQMLYTGVQSIDIEGDRRSLHAQTAIAAVEQQLAYAPNGALMGSSSIRLPNPLFAPWLYLKYQDSKTWVGKALHRMGKRPKWMREVNPTLRAKVAERLLSEHGYLGAQVESRIIPSKDSLQGRVAYEVRLGELYLLDSIEYLPRWYVREDHAFDHQRYSILQRGKPFAVASLSEDRGNASAYLREQGYYYFAPQYIHYEADTLMRPGAVQLRSRLVGNLSEDVLRQWRVRHIRLRFLDGDDASQLLSTDTLELSPGVTAYSRGSLPVRPRVLDQRLRLRPDSLYRYSNEDLTRKSLVSIGAFSGIEMLFARSEGTDSLPSSSPGELDLTILLRKDRPWDVSFGSRFLFKSTDFMGPGLSLSLSRRNVFGGGETFSASLSGSYEWQTGSNPFRSYSLSLNSYLLSLDASLSFPTLLTPGRLDKYYAFPTTTTIKLSGQRMNRAGYYALNSLSLSSSYDFSRSSGRSHSLVPLSISYSQLGHTTEEFRTILEDNPSLGLSLMSQLIAQMSYTYTRDWQVGRERQHRLWLRAGASQAGFVTKGLFALVGKSYREQQRILGVPFAQFVKAHGELRYTHHIDRKQSLALRLGGGAIYSYGNMERAPYMEQFYVGGANSIRAFTVRSLGPGSFAPKQTESAYAFMDHVGEVKLEANAEWRARLVGSLEGALFLDAGNIWLLKPDPDRPGGALSEVGSLGNLLNQIAVGTGAGLRYDVGYLVVRFDVGVGLHLPYKTTRSGWYNIPRFSDALGIHLAIGYPF